MKYRSIMPASQFSWRKTTFNGDTVIRWNKTEITIGEDIFAECDEMVVKGRPTLLQVKTLVLDAINEDTDRKILGGFAWDAPGADTAINVWLSEENQFNYKAAYDLAVQTQGASLPFVLKFGASDSPRYYTFNDVATFSDFYLSAIAFINGAVREGWEKKDGIDWSVYEEV